MDELISMTKTSYMLDTNTCSFLIQKKPEYLLEKLQQTAQAGHPIVVSAITYAELLLVLLIRKPAQRWLA